jgi:hypothetical protein
MNTQQVFLSAHSLTQVCQIGYPIKFSFQNHFFGNFLMVHTHTHTHIPLWNQLDAPVLSKGLSDGTKRVWQEEEAPSVFWEISIQQTNTNKTKSKQPFFTYRSLFLFTSFVHFCLRFWVVFLVVKCFLGINSKIVNTKYVVAWTWWKKKLVDR